MYKHDLGLNNLQWLKSHQTKNKPKQSNRNIAQSAGAVEYTDCSSAEG